ncbi:hypothetical protein BDV95DRAFT_492089 [Massariosphaeria phaeospora]|uniref:Uncharacterized protein n=1 Tax=Massariosphaeria phaeospora TaxID=100035 RepID=A0A7C8I734_9PLEO|nr:hypothetical protein BDV95DRAFT_492089 [Massariosphaeria phaeospora]
MDSSSSVSSDHRAPATTTTTAPTSAASLFSRRPSFFGRSRARKAAATASTAPSPLPDINFDAFSPSPSTAAASNPPPLAASQYEAADKVPSTPPRRKHSSRHSISSSVTEFGSSLRRSRSASLRTNTSSGTASSHKMALSLSPEKPSAANAAPTASRPALSISTFARSKQKSAENIRPPDSAASRQAYEKSPLSAVDNPKQPLGMAVAVPLRYPPTQKEIQQAHQAQRQHSTYGAASYNGGLAPAAPISLPNGANPNIIFQHIQEMASKRISTLDYLKKSHEGRIYWFNTLLFSKTDLTRLPSFSPRNLSRRATHYLLLGFSLPPILDLNANNATDYLKALNALLLEFEQYQSMHPADGSTPSSLSRARIPQMFKRVNVGSKARRSSSAASDLPLLTPQSSFNETQSSVDSPPTDDVLLPNESYIHLQTPSLPFDPDFFTTFATLCDVLIDCYNGILSLLSSPESIAAAGAGVPSVVGDLFNKADARVRKIILAGVVREFEENCRQGVKGEVGGVGKVVLGGLM